MSTLLVKLFDLIFHGLAVLLYGGELGEPTAVKALRLFAILAVIAGVALVFLIF